MTGSTLLAVVAVLLLAQHLERYRRSHRPAGDQPAAPPAARSAVRAVRPSVSLPPVLPPAVSRTQRRYADVGSHRNAVGKHEPAYHYRGSDAQIALDVLHDCGFEDEPPHRGSRA